MIDGTLGSSRTKELCTTDEQLSEMEAADEDSITTSTRGALEEAVASFVERLASKPPLAVRAVKDTVNAHQETGLAEGRRHERRVIDTLRETANHEEGPRAFVENWKPEWEGR
jgi:enoyl-CoA hydratase/carnithine racemase